MLAARIHYHARWCSNSRHEEWSQIWHWKFITLWSSFIVFGNFRAAFISEKGSGEETNILLWAYQMTLTTTYFNLYHHHYYHWMITTIILSFLIFRILHLKDPALSSGEIAGVVIGVLIAVILLSVVIVYFLNHVGIIDFGRKMDDGKKLLGFSNENYEQNMASSPGFNSVMFFKEKCEDRPVSPTTVAT